MLGFLCLIGWLIAGAFACAYLVHKRDQLVAKEAADKEADARAAELHEWISQRPKHRFCPSCKGDLAEKEFDGKKKLACTRCSYVNWDNPLPVVCMLVVSEDGKKLLLIKRQIPPRIGFFALPGGYMESLEGEMEGAIRETKEETGYDVEIVRWHFTAPVPGKNEFLVFFIGKVVGGEAKESLETSDITFFDIDNLPENIAFPLHQKAIDLYRESLKTS